MKFSKKIIAALIIISGVVVAGVTTSTILTLPQESFESKIQGLMARFQIPSLAAGIVVNNSLVWADGFGEQPDIDTVYMIGSITKSFTATAALQLYERNLFQLDDDINDYLPFELRNPNFPDTPITIRMLLSHKSGITRDSDYSHIWFLDNQTIEWLNENVGTDYVYWDQRPSLEEYLKGNLITSGAYYTPEIWNSEPGSQFLYSNLGYQLLWYLIEQVTNQPMTEYVQENILNPLNMTNSGYNYLDFAGKNALPYEWIENRNFELTLYNGHSIGSGALRCTVPDLANFMIAHMNSGRFNGVQLLKPETVELMHEKQSSLSGTTTGGFNVDGYGFGWIIYTEEFQGHNGAVPGFLANVFLKETEQGAYGAMVMVNRGFIYAIDEGLEDEFFPTINDLLLEEAENLFNS